MSKEKAASEDSKQFFNSQAEDNEMFPTRCFYETCKRFGDILLSLAAGIVLLPFMMIISLIIYIDDPTGSPVFKQTRVGKDGKLFTMYKLRSMHTHAEEELDDLINKNEMSGPAFKMTNDPRVTSIGRFIRRTSIDELPQLWNIIKGDMSIVGPRPALPCEVKNYTDYQRERLTIKPGLTCYWQVHPRKYEISFDEWMRLDEKYIRERGFAADLKIILATVKTVLMMNGK